MGAWKQYLAVLDKKGTAAAWAYAQKHFPKNSLDYAEAQKHHAPTAAQQKQSAANRKAIERELNPEFVKQNCQVGFLRK